MLAHRHSCDSSLESQKWGQAGGWYQLYCPHLVWLGELTSIDMVADQWGMICETKFKSLHTYTHPCSCLDMCIHKHEKKESMNIYVFHVHTHEMMANKQWTPSSLSATFIQLTLHNCKTYFCISESKILCNNNNYSTVIYAGCINKDILGVVHGIKNSFACISVQPMLKLLKPILPNYNTLLFKSGCLDVVI